MRARPSPINETFVPVRDSLLSSKDFSSDEKLLISLLERYQRVHQSVAFQYQSTLADELGMSTQKVKRLIRSLAKKNALKVGRFKNRRGNYYEVTEVPRQSSKSMGEVSNSTHIENKSSEQNSSHGSEMTSFISRANAEADKDVNAYMRQPSQGGSTPTPKIVDEVVSMYLRDFSRPIGSLDLATRDRIESIYKRHAQRHGEEQARRAFSDLMRGASIVDASLSMEELMRADIKTLNGYVMAARDMSS